MHTGNTRTIDKQTIKLEAPAKYFPLRNDRYEVTIGLSKLGKDLGNGAVDSRVFQLDCEFPTYRKQKLEALAERQDKYCCAASPSEQGLHKLHVFMAQQLAAEYPQHFRIKHDTDHTHTLHCQLTGSIISVHSDAVDMATTDALCREVQEDIALVEWHGDTGARVSALHLCYPNHWSAEEKIGRSLLQVHHPVPGFPDIARAAERLLKASPSKGTFVRFAWGLTTDTRLNHHPEPPPDHEPLLWSGRRFWPENPRLYMRIERQTITGLDDASAAVFTIRTYFSPVEELPQSELRQLHGTLHSMSENTLVYKGLKECKPGILGWLNRLLTNG